MSDSLSGAAEALGLPEALVRRSAAARAAETGADVEEILAAWAGGEAPAQAAAPPLGGAGGDRRASEPEEEPEEAAAPEQEEPEEEPQPAPAPAQPEVVVEVPEREPISAGGAPAFGAAATRPPVLVGARDNPLTLLTAVVGLFLAVVLVAAVGPSIPLDEPGARTSQIQYTELAEDGRDVYRTLGCTFCHTQMVRPVVADVGLGAVTLSDSNQVLGVRRFGPDLSDAGTRLAPAQIEAIVSGFDGHPPHNLAGEDMAALVAYLAESRTSPDEPEEPEIEEAEETGAEEEETDG